MLQVLAVVGLVLLVGFVIVSRVKGNRPGVDPSLVDARVDGLAQAATVQLSLVVPAYNEEQRLPKMMVETLRYLEERFPGKYEVVIVDDGSKDRTFQVASEYARTHPVRPVRLRQNMGKGYAVKVGMHCARGHDLLMVDADGATCIRDFDRLLSAREPVVFGSRHHLKDDAVARRSFIRTVLMYGFHTLLRILIGPGPQDTQCGFKLFRRDAARVLFANQRLPRWSFDVELVMIAGHCGLAIGEVPVNWVEIPGSKLNIVTDAIQMLRDIVALRLFYATGIWTVRR